jgi:hypothetical protein
MDISGVGGTDDLPDGEVDVGEAGHLVVIGVPDGEDGEREKK